MKFMKLFLGAVTETTAGRRPTLDAASMRRWAGRKRPQKKGGQRAARVSLGRELLNDGGHGWQEPNRAQ